MALLRKIFGHIAWTPPDWVTRIGARKLGLGAAAVVALCIAIAAGANWYNSLPKPAMVSATVASPGLSNVVNDELRPEPLSIRFRIKADPRTPLITSDSVARIDLVDKALTEGVTIEPAIEGEWRWESETELKFQPATDWPAGQKYAVRYEPSIFAPNLRFESNESEFVTPEFAARIEEISFYQDPVEAGIRKVVATLKFSHPVDRQSLQQLVGYTMRPTGATIDDQPEIVEYEVTYDELDRIAYLHSTPIEIPPQENYMTLHVAKGLAPVAGPSRQQEDAVRNVRIPDVGSYFRVENANGIIARSENNDPVQTIVINFTDRVSVESLKERLTAYVLPEDNANGASRRYWQSPREVTPTVLSNSERLELELNPTEQDSASMHSANIRVEENRAIYLKVARGLTSDGEFELARDYDTIVRSPTYPREVNIAQAGALLPLTSSRRLTFVSRGVQVLRVEVGRLHEDDVNHIASQTGGDISSPYFSNWQFNEDNVTTRSTKFIDIEDDDPGTASYSSLDLTEYLPDGGYYFITVQGWDREQDYAVGNADRRFVLVTDIGLLTKSSADSTHEVFVHSISTGQPIAGATIELLGKNGVPIVSRASSATGHVSIPATNDFKREKTPTVFVVRNGRDSVFMPYQRHSRMLQYSRFDIGGRYAAVQKDEQKLRALVFSDRGIYRPGDSVNLAAIVKRDDWQSLGQLPLRLQVRDPRGQMVMDRSLELDEGGFIDQAFPTEAASPTGDYRAVLYLVGKQNGWWSLGATQFKVEEFQPDRLRIRTEMSGQKPVGWLKPEGLAANVTLQNLFGTPAQTRRVTGQITLTPRSIRMQKYAGFTFGDPLRQRGTALLPIQQNLSDAYTDVDGRATLPIDLSRYANGIYQLSVLTEGFEEGGGRGVKARASVMVSPLDYLVGHKADANLAFLKKSSEHSVELVAVDSDGNSIALDDLTLNITEQRYVSSLVQRPNGTYAYQSVKKEIPVSSEALVIPEDGGQYALPTAQPGSFVASVVDADGLTFSKVEFTVAGDRNVAGNLERNAELELNLNSDEFSPGDEIEIEITAPYTGTGLITIERNRVYAHRWIHSDTTTSVHRIRVPDDLEGNAYVNVAFVRSLDSPEIYISPLSYAVAPFSINKATRTVDINLDVPALVRPGDRIDIQHTSSKPSKVVVYAVDEGILQVARYSTPDPLKQFLPKMALQVMTYQLVDLILPDFDMLRRFAAPGGGEAAGLAGSNLNPFRRKTDAPVAFWSGVVDSGPESQTVSFDIPDYFNGELRVMAVAASDTAVGNAQAKTIVRAPFVITPNVATAVAPGDEFDVNVGLANNLEEGDDTTTIKLEATASDGLVIVGESAISLSIDRGSEGRARFRVKALERLGAASISFRASAADEETQSTATLSVRPPVAYVATMQSGSTTRDPFMLEFERDLHDEFAKQSVAASASPLILADGMLNYLDAFPHLCAEQIVSKVFPQIGFLGNGDLALDETNIRRMFDDTITKLRRRQGPEGGFRFWVSSPEPARFPSVYIMHFLTDAKAIGLPVPADMLTAGYDYLKRVAGEPFDSLSDARLRAYAIYVLTRSGEVTSNYLTYLHETLDQTHTDAWQNDLVSAYMAASYALLQQARLGDALITEYVLGSGDEMHSDFDTRLGRDAQYFYLVSRHFPDKLSDIDPASLENLINPVMKNRFNTLSSAYTILALGEYTKAVFDDRAAELSISVTTGDRSEALVEAARFARSSVENAVTSLEITGAAGEPVFYVASQTGFDRTAPTEPLAEGLEIHKEYLDDAGNEVSSAEIGDELTVRLRVRSKGRARTNVAVVDLLPGGFEVLTESVRGEYRGWYADYFDIREDRVVIYGTFGDRVTELAYRVKATAAGDFIAPSAFAAAMYDRDVRARTSSGRFEVSAVQ